MSNLNQNTMVSLLNSSTISGVVNLPLTTDIPFRSIIFKDFTGYTNSNSTISLSTVGTDTFENGSTYYILNSPNSFVSFYANTYTKQWNTLYTSDWWKTPAGGTVNMNSNAFDNTLYTQYIDLITGLSNYLFSFSNGIFYYYNSNIGYPTPIASDWWQFSAGCNVNMNGNAIQNVNEIDVNYIYGTTMGAPVTFGTNLDMNNNEISNVQQTSNINSVATNTVISQSFSGVIDNTSFGIGSFTQLIVSFPLALQFMNPNNFFTNVWQTTFTFNAALASIDTNYAFYFSLSNIIRNVETTGINFNSNTPYCITSNFVNPFNISASYTDSFDLSSWGLGDYYCVLLYFQGLTVITNNFNSGSYTSFLQPSIQYIL